jgi:hypothetical protein
MQDNSTNHERRNRETEKRTADGAYHHPNQHYAPKEPSQDGEAQQRKAKRYHPKSPCFLFGSELKQIQPNST